MSTKVSNFNIYAQSNNQNTMEQIFTTGDIPEQSMVLCKTVKHPISLFYPASKKHRIAFLKKMLKYLETKNVEISDELYECLAETLLSPENTDLAYKTYSLDESQYLVVQESVNFISQGTTGLCMWTAGLYLSEWCMENQSLLQNKRILELGSGIGLTGLVMAHTSGCKHFIFSDCHERVLQTLLGNVNRNRHMTTLSKCLTCNKTMVNWIPLRHCKLEQHVCSECDKASREKRDDSSVVSIGTNSDSYRGYHERVNCNSIHKPISAENLSKPNDMINPPSGSVDGPEDKTNSEEDDLPFSKCSCPVVDIVNINEIQQKIYAFSSNSDVSMKDHAVDTKSVSAEENHINVDILDLDWESVTISNVERLGESMDIVIASDVVYDRSIIPSLVLMLKHLLVRSSRKAYVASTIRNPDTIDFFHKTLEMNNLKFTTLCGPTLQIFCYNRSDLFEIIEITHQ